jgi:hypothetical protein
MIPNQLKEPPTIASGVDYWERVQILHITARRQTKVSMMNWAAAVYASSKTLSN